METEHFLKSIDSIKKLYDTEIINYKNEIGKLKQEIIDLKNKIRNLEYRATCSNEYSNNYSKKTHSHSYSCACECDYCKDIRCDAENFP